MFCPCKEPVAAYLLCWLKSWRCPVAKKSEIRNRTVNGCLLALHGGLVRRHHGEIGHLIPAETIKPGLERNKFWPVALLPLAFLPGS